MTTIPCAPPTIPCAPPAHMQLAEFALAYFVLPSDLPPTTHGRTTTTPPVVLPAEFTHTLCRVREMRGTP